MKKAKWEVVEVRTQRVIETNHGASGKRYLERIYGAMLVGWPVRHLAYLRKS